MLRALSIRNVLLIDQLDVIFTQGLGVLTGETGAGKSILLDAMGLALGERASPQLIRTGETQATVTAQFELPAHSPVYEILQDLGLFIEGQELLLRRILNVESGSRAFVNDQPVSLALLRKLGETLVEIHGQFDQLLNPLTHRRYLDHFGRLMPDLEKVRDAFTILENARRTLEQAQSDLSNKQIREAFLKQALQELEEAAPKEGEEERLLKERIYLQHHAKITEAAQNAYSLLGGDKGVEAVLGNAHRALERVSDAAEDIFVDALTALDRASIETQEVLSILLTMLRRSGGEASRTFEVIEDRLHILRGLARKHLCTVDNLALFQEKFREEQEHLMQGSDYLRTLEQELEKAKMLYLQEAASLSEKRQKVARSLEEALKKEFIPLKLEKASLHVQCIKLPENAWSAEGFDRLEFQIQTNPGMPFGSFSKIASGGERARLMLALKVILAQESGVSLLIFDEIDTGVSGSVSFAIGERLSRLGKHLQLLAVTHSPQVAAYADCHWYVSKQTQEGKTTTQVLKLDEVGREEEMARMLAGESVTPEARAAARRLLEAGKAVA
ncbi:DNA repair protein RecN [Caedimonas varicaedens]|uniref:DNA repair protein RecN n=1 Tax=Caedimonas varicaedens TaxID=1629334 RepID=A0A0K8MD33_9PROT|nr:DNA repair protein RecN [Caedimonas varicaedens]